MELYEWKTERKLKEVMAVLADYLANEIPKGWRILDINGTHATVVDTNNIRYMNTPTYFLESYQNHRVELYRNGSLDPQR